MKKANSENGTEQYDVVIVGMGIAGCILAHHLSDRLSVLLIDYRKLPIKKACSGILTRQSIEALSDYDLPENIFNEPKFIDICYVNVLTDTKNLTKKGFLNADRAKLDDFFYKQLEEKPNLNVLDDTRLIDFQIKDSETMVTLQLKKTNKVRSIKTTYLVGCDGANSTVRNKITERKIPNYLAVQELLPTQNKPSLAYFVYDPEVTDFYYWVIPKTDGVEVGAAFKPDEASAQFSLLKEKVKDAFGFYGKGKTTAAPVLRPASIDDICLGKGNVLLCGEAAGLITFSSAEGISFAVRSAKACAAVLNDSNTNVADEYTRQCSGLLERLQEKIAKADLLSSSSGRGKMLTAEQKNPKPTMH